VEGRASDGFQDRLTVDRLRARLMSGRAERKIAITLWLSPAMDNPKFDDGAIVNAVLALTPA